MDSRAIGVFDSGVGGLSAVKALMNLMPEENIVYFGDTARVPYGTRDKETIIKYAQQDLRFLMKHDLKMVVVACGTVSATALSTLRDESDVTVVGIIDAAVDKAVNLTRNGKIAILGTEATISSGSFENTIHKKNNSIKTIGVACPLFVPLVENGYINKENKITQLVVEEYLEPVKKFGADTIILGCTHYPILKAAIGEQIPDIKIVDSSKEMAFQLENKIKSLNIQNCMENVGKQRYFVSGSTEKFEKVATVFLGEKFTGETIRVKLEDYTQTF